MELAVTPGFRRIAHGNVWFRVKYISADLDNKGFMGNPVSTTLITKGLAA
jgi:hypothetical protein